MVESRPPWVPPDIDLRTATLARVYDYMLGGAHNFAVDREVADRLERLVPGTIRSAWENRAFLRRAVLYCASLGIDQYLDIGSGIPTGGNVHEVARSVLPTARVVYVDLDPVAVLHSRAILTGDALTGVVQGDLRAPEAILDDPVTRQLIDFERPVAVLLVALLHVIPDSAHPAELLTRLTAGAGPGSHLVISHFGPNYGTPEQVQALVEWSRGTTTPMLARDPAELTALLGDFVPVPPGVVAVHEWKPDPDGPVSDHSGGYAVVARRD
jgi:S-adenosyl methyltransferase